MNIGDKVRLLHGREEGVIKRFLKNNMVEIEIEDGFTIPVLVNELVSISKTEGQVFRGTNKIEEQKIQVQKPIVRSNIGVFLGFMSVNDKSMLVYVINNTDWDLPFVLTQGSDKTHRGLMAGSLKAYSTQKSEVELKTSDFDEWGLFSFQAFYYSQGYFPQKNILEKKMRMKANSFFNQKKTAPLIEKEMYLFQLDAQSVENDAFTSKINAEELKNSMLSANEKFVLEPIAKFSKPNKAVDLHIEQLTTDFMAMSNAQIIELQLRTFESNLELAIATGMDEITFIHGVGAGILRDEIHKKLSKHKNVAWFQDAQKEKFGYGATKVKIK